MTRNLNSRDLIKKNKTNFQLIRSLFSQYPWHTLSVVVALFLSGIMESLGLISLIPILSISLESSATSTAGSQLVTELVGGLLQTFGLTPEFGVLLGFMALTIIFKAIFHFLAMRYVGTVTANIARDLRFSVIKSVISAKWEFFISKPIGYFSNTVNSEASASSSLYIAACNFISSFIHVFLFTGMALLLNLEIAIWALVVGIIMLFTLGRFVTHAKQAGEHQAVSMKALVRILTDSLQGIKSLKVMGLERFLLPLLKHEVVNLNQAHRKQIIAKHALNDFREPFIVIFICVGLYVAVEKMGLAMSGLIVIALVFHRTLNAIGRLQASYQQISVAQSFFQSLNNTVEEAEHVAETFHKGKSHYLKNNIYFQNVSFSFGDEGVLKNQTFDIKAGELTVIVGPSGAGKSTLLDLIAGLYKPKSGEIYIDDSPLNGVDLKAWRENIGYVPQDLFLFHDTVLNNITLGDEKIDVTMAVKALTQAGAMEFVEKLSDGINTIIGERGIRLSGGQRQRLSIARALVREPQLLILDEAFTALDPETEKKICKELSELGKNITIIAISHQNAIVEVADTVLRLKNGEISSVKSEK